MSSQIVLWAGFLHDKCSVDMIRYLHFIALLNDPESSLYGHAGFKTRREPNRQMIGALGTSAPHFCVVAESLNLPSAVGFSEDKR